jgi:hypothetical protein
MRGCSQVYSTCLSSKGPLRTTWFSVPEGTRQQSISSLAFSVAVRCCDLRGSSRRMDKFGKGLFTFLFVP